LGYDARSAEGIAPWRRNLDEAFLGFVERLVAWVGQHWLAVVNGAVALFAFLPLAAPLLMAAGLMGPARVIYYAYSYTCHQMPSRSFFLFGQQMAYCERDTAIYLAVLLAGLVFSRWRDRLPRLSFKAYLLLILPMAIDGFTQAFGWRESTWALRVFTGALFGVASVWLIYPYLQQSIEEMRAGG
jgi:uncharacterized membrane protein